MPNLNPSQLLPGLWACRAISPMPDEGGLSDLEIQTFNYFLDLHRLRFGRSQNRRRPRDGFTRGRVEAHRQSDAGSVPRHVLRPLAIRGALAGGGDLSLCL